MIGLALCVVAFVLCRWQARRGLVEGLTAMLIVGYLYGILRANVAQASSHFIFDAALLGVYSVHLLPWRMNDESRDTRSLHRWLEFLIAWPLFMALIPIQDYMVQLVGFRGNAFLLPLLVIGARLQGGDLERLAPRVAVLNLIAFGVAAAEFVVGIEPFFPRNAVTELMYRSNDVLGAGTLYRIPSIFTSAHAYGGTMVATLPLLLGALHARGLRGGMGWLLTAAAGASMIGVLMSAARSHAVLLFLVLVVAVFSVRSTITAYGAAVVGVALLGIVVSREARLQRFRTIENTEYVSERISGSVHAGILEVAMRYPMGNGMGGGGTSMPYFLQSRLRGAVVVENDFARVMLEQGIFGLLLWLMFLSWLLLKRQPPPAAPWWYGRRLMRVFCALHFMSGLIGLGSLTSVPQSCLALLWGGVLVTPAFGLRRRITRAQEEASAIDIAGVARA